MANSSIVNVAPMNFISVRDLSTNVSYIYCGPQTVVLQSQEELLGGPFPFVVIPPGHYCAVKNPVVKGVPGQACDVKFGAIEYRFNGTHAPFPLYPGEVLVDGESFAVTAKTYKSAIKSLLVLTANQAINLMAISSFEDSDGQKRSEGDMWQVQGPLTYYPRSEVEIIAKVTAHVIHPGEALHLMAKQNMVDRNGNPRLTGEEWLVDTVGSYLPGVFEEVVKVVKALVPTADMGFHVRATQDYVDFLDIRRSAGEEWLVTKEHTVSYIVPIGAVVVAPVKLTVLRKGQFCVVVNPVSAVVNPMDKKREPQWGTREVRVGHTSFFLHPGEALDAKGVQDAYILADNEMLLLQAEKQFTDDRNGEKKVRKSGERWLVYGPTEFVPHIDEKVVCLRKAIPLAENEGIYVRDICTGRIRAELGPQAYVLKETEQLYNKPLPPTVEELLVRGGGIGLDDIRKMAYFEQCVDPAILKGREKSRVVTYRCPVNTACQVLNHEKRTARVIFGPDLVVLGPHEQFNVLSLSAGKPKKPHSMKTLCLMLGPDYITDIIEVETCDHARLQIKLAFNNHFDVVRGDPAAEAQLFAVPDFIGFACSVLGSRIRAVVAQTSFDEFHRHSAQIVRHAVFGESGSDVVKFPENRLVITSVDVQSIEPVDVRMRESLMRSVQMAIEIATKSVEASAAHEAQRHEQVARGLIDRQQLDNEREAERERQKLYELRAQSAAVESTGQAIAEARAQAERLRIEGESDIEVTRLKMAASKLEHDATLSTTVDKQNAELAYHRRMNEEEISKSQQMASIEVDKFSKLTGTLGHETVKALATSPNHDGLKILESVGMETSIITQIVSSVTALGSTGHLLSLGN